MLLQLLKTHSLIMMIKMIGIEFLEIQKIWIKDEIYLKLIDKTFM